MTDDRGQMAEDPSSLSELRRGTQRTGKIGSLLGGFIVGWCWTD